MKKLGKRFVKLPNRVICIMTGCKLKTVNEVIPGEVVRRLLQLNEFLAALAAFFIGVLKGSAQFALEFWTNN